MIFLAIDYGARRLGLALCDEGERLALPLQTLTRRVNDLRGDLAALLDLARARGVEAVVMGVPGGSAQSDAMAQDSRRFALKLQEAARERGWEVPFFEADERFSTAQAHSVSGGAPRSRDASGAGSIDARAAAIFLQTFLDARRRDDVWRDDARRDDDLTDFRD